MQDLDPKSYLLPTYHTSAVIDPGHAKVKPIVANIIGTETDPLRKAQLVCVCVLIAFSCETELRIDCHTRGEDPI